MLSTKAVISDFKEVPPTWIFEHYCGLTQRLIGQDVEIKSIFNPTEKHASMRIYLDVVKNKYLFKDFSTGKGGDALNLVCELYDLSLSKGVHKLIGDYSAFLSKNKSYNQCEMKCFARYKVVDYVTRNWTNVDAKYWMSYEIDSKSLEHYNVMPIESYTMSNQTNELHIKGLRMYGYFRGDGKLCKIYNPGSDVKFVKVRDYIQGSNQLTYKKPNLVIQSSLKDVLAFNTFKFESIECIAPDSENVMIPDNIMWYYIDHYESVITLFDNDEAGRKSVEKYRKKYSINGFCFDMEKDVSDAIKRFGSDHVKDAIYPELLTNIKTNKRCQENLTLE